uniref:PLAT domain-containing protein n=1 Tax=Musca domestica TaxID=7370 RepID=A0A1I8MBX7_MUSDO
MSSYSLVLRMSWRGRERGLDFVTEARCFILVLPKPVKAVIAGGLRRQIGIAQNVLLDGSKSRDFALAPDALQDLFFNWSCVSLQEAGDEFCHKNMGTGKELHQNDIGKIIIAYSDKAQQEVHIVTDHQLNVDMKCRRNCLRDQYVAGSTVHVEGICWQCPPKINFYWTVNGVEQRENHRHFIYNPKNEETRLLIDLAVEAEALKGHFSIEFQLNTPPSGGHCSVIPSAGTALETEFRIQCESYEDQDMPLDFHYFSGHFPLKRINEAQIILKLPESNTLTVLICDQWNACTETILDVDISALPRPSNFHEFLLANGTDPKGLFENSQRLAAFVLLKSVVRFVTTEDEANFVVDQVHNISLLTLLEIEQWLAISHDLVMNLRPLDYRKSLAVTKYIQKLRQGLQLIIEDQEIKYLNIERYQLATHQIVDLMREFAKPWEPPMDIQTLMPETIMATDPLAEHYSELSDFDILVMEKIANWLELSKEVERSFQMFSSQATHIYQPKEPAFVINEHPCEMLLYAIDDATRQTIALGEPSMEVHLSSEAILNLQSLVKSHDLVIQVGSMGMNRFWWYPHELPISSDVLYFSTFPRLPPSSRLNSPLSIKFHLKISLANQEIQGKFKARQHMSMFTVEVPSHSLLVLKTHNLDSSISIGIGLGEKPTGFQMQQTISKLDASQLSSQKVNFAFNNNSHTTEAYIAFLAQEEVSEFPLFFKFSVDIYQCLYWEWNMENPQWSSDGCRPKYNVTVNWQELECENHHFSDFAARTYQPTVKEDLREYWLLDHLPINWHILIFYILSLLVFLTVLLINFRRIRNTRSILISDAKHMEHPNLEIFIYTGSHWNSSSTSNIKFRFVSERGPYTLRIFQNPWRPQLLRNSICQLLLDGQNVKFPFKMVISGDQTGRFPSWYCHRITAHNHATKEKQIFLVNNWITQQPLEVMPSLSGDTWSERFHEHLSNFYINWFHFQPLWGPAKYNDSCSLQRSCIWVSQTFASVCIISCYYGPTTMDSYERDRDTYFYLRFKAGELFMLSSVDFSLTK